ncbi:hypothetical protein C8J57DRAFT_8784 [Mycena rebaudengoi]|nr:hypothetical protein C8J57DRAFT_8784 [Mycena rebaudengoi]
MADDDERAAKAARAKAMLKKRQQKKTATGAAASGLASPISPPPSRTLTPAPPQPVEDEKHDLGDVFAAPTGKDDSDWLSGLARAPSPPPAAAASPRAESKPPPRVVSPPARTTLTSPPQSKDTQLQKQLSALQAENEALSADIERLRQVESPDGSSVTRVALCFKIPGGEDSATAV